MSTVIQEKWDRFLGLLANNPKLSNMVLDPLDQIILWPWG